MQIKEALHSSYIENNHNYLDTEKKINLNIQFNI